MDTEFRSVPLHVNLCVSECGMHAHLRFFWPDAVIAKTQEFASKEMLRSALTVCAGRFRLTVRQHHLLQSMIYKCDLPEHEDEVGDPARECIKSDTELRQLLKDFFDKVSNASTSESREIAMYMQGPFATVSFN